MEYELECRWSVWSDCGVCGVFKCGVTMERAHGVTVRSECGMCGVNVKLEYV